MVLLQLLEATCTLSELSVSPPYEISRDAMFSAQRSSPDPQAVITIQQQYRSSYTPQLPGSPFVSMHLHNSDCSRLNLTLFKSKLCPRHALRPQVALHSAVIRFRVKQSARNGVPLSASRFAAVAHQRYPKPVSNGDVFFSIMVSARSCVGFNSVQLGSLHP